MKVWGVTEGELRAAASEAGVAIHNDYFGHGIEADGRALRFRLNVDRSQPRDENGNLPFQRIGYRGRRIAAVSWEGHREFMRILFRDHPEARLKSAVADYRGRDDFWVKHPETRGKWGERSFPGF